jgi:pantetheine-phosphate adenylyltransferase
MGRIAVFPGSFDPFTLGHYDIVQRAMPLFDEIVIAIGINSSKNTLFSLGERKQYIASIFEGNHNISIDHFEGLTAHFCQKIKANFLIRGLRNASDFDYEKTISQLNFIIGGKLETVFLISSPAHSHISSTMVREIIKGGGDVSPFLCKPIAKL